MTSSLSLYVHYVSSPTHMHIHTYIRLHKHVYTHVVRHPHVYIEKRTNARIHKHTHTHNAEATSQYHSINTLTLYAETLQHEHSSIKIRVLVLLWR